jgi:hypothetical protein
VAQRHVERLGGDIFLREVRQAAFDAGPQRPDDGGMLQIERDDTLELARYRGGLLGRDVEAEDLDGREPIELGLIRAEDRAENANTDLMKDTKGPEGGRRSEGIRLVQRQVRLLAGKITRKPRLFNEIRSSP